VRTYVYLLLVLATSAWLHGQNVVLNGGFELPGLPETEDVKFLTNGSTFISGWTVIDDGVGQQPFYGTRRLNDAVLNGSYGVVLNQESGIKTTFRAKVGAFYELGLWLRPDDCHGCVTPAPLRVTLSGNSVSLEVLSGWSYQTVQFFATNSVNTLELYNPASTSDFKRYTIDDVAIQEVAGAVLGARLQPVVTVDGTIGAKYQIQAATNLNAPLWTTLTNLILSNSPTFFLDTTAAHNFGRAPQRIYRAVRVPQ
jgi:hypothetical protein